MFFSICFVNLLSQFRLKLDKSIRNSKAILILDGHKSRENPVAIKILKQHNIEVFIIPAHTSHLTQLYDVGIGSSMKSAFPDFLKKLMKDFEIDKNDTGQLRLFCVRAAILSFDLKANKKACTTAAKLTGLNPIDDSDLLNSTFVQELTPEIQKYIKKKKNTSNENELNINCKFITNDQYINVTNEFISCSKFHKHLSLMNYDGNYLNNVSSLCKRFINDCRFLSTIPCFYDTNSSKIIFF